jgi:hypothetical protein
VNAEASSQMIHVLQERGGGPGGRDRAAARREESVLQAKPRGSIP